MTVGTSHFKSRAAAIRYYKPYGNDEASVDQKITEGEIHIGSPAINEGDKLTLIDGGTRYQIEKGSLYEALKAAGIQVANHESDLYFPITAESTAILDRYPTSKGNAEQFNNQVEGGRWYDVPFAYTPWWDARKAKGGKA